MDFEIVKPDAAQFAEIAALWHGAWHKAHAAHVPQVLVKLRTQPDFERRLVGLHHGLRVALQGAKVSGLCCTVDDEMQQLFVARAAYGTGLAAALLGDAETRLAQAGVQRAWLACAIGNGRAAAFYRKAGWVEIGRMIDPLETSEGLFDLEVLRFEKELTAAVG